MKWLRRTDDARRMKGDPPPTVEQLLATVRQQGDVIRSLRHQCDGLIAENARLRATRTWPPGPIELWICPVEGHTDVEWSGNVAHCMACDRTSADPVDDPKPTLREERLPLRPGHVDVAELAMPGLTEGERAAFLESAEFFGEAGKDETR